MSNVLVYLLFLMVIFYILGIFFYLISKWILKTDKIAILILSNFPLLIKRLLKVAGILFFISLLIIWVLIYIIPVKISFISVPLNYLSAILFAISLSFIEVIFFLLGFITFKNKTSINTEKINNNEAQNKSLNKLIIILLSIAMILSVFIDYFASLGFIIK
ncbi:MAG TPA: hypothetical protein PLD35_05155 [Caldisericia bacterium]|mgnify:FL=1|nr:hypothetical protein [Caldisericia bacterium]HPO29385.1 hypothetical protein [Caldisericia bacterium]HXK70323.1 hypothetical protein [Caldisericia bacterium]